MRLPEVRFKHQTSFQNGVMIADGTMAGANIIGGQDFYAHGGDDVTAVLGICHGVSALWNTGAAAVNGLRGNGQAGPRMTNALAEFLKASGLGAQCISPVGGACMVAAGIAIKALQD